MKAIDRYTELETAAERHRYYSACVELMDDQLREILHGLCVEAGGCSEGDFLRAYCDAEPDFTAD